MNTETPKNNSSRLLLIPYIIISFEIIYMISPFGVYYYSVYGPALNALMGVPSVAWLGRFFLPHFSQSTFWLLNASKDLGWTLAIIGFVGFSFGAFQIYWSKFTNKAAVTRGVYGVVRHPQYAFLILCSFGLLLVWPRYLILGMFVTMQFAYYLLARSEERQCLNLYGNAYRDWMLQHGMFLPWPKPRPRFLGLATNGQRGNIATGFRLLIVYVFTLALAFFLAYSLCLLSVRTISSVYGKCWVAVSLVSMNKDKMIQILEIAKADPTISESLNSSDGDARIDYIIPSDWYLSDIPMPIPEGAEGHVTPDTFNPDRFKVLFTAVSLDGNGVPEGNRILTAASHRRPLVMAEVDLATKQVLRGESLPETVRWGDIPTPLF